MNKLFIYLCFAYAVFASACSSPKNIPYFIDLPDSVNANVPQTTFIDPKIQPDDIVSITIQTADPNAAASVNQKIDGISALGASSASNIGSQQVSGFLV